MSRPRHARTNDDLPTSVREIADVIGRERALFLIGQLPRSGSRSWRVCFYVPKRMGLDHQLVQILGWHDAEKLRNAFGGEILQVANCNGIRRTYRNRVIWRLRAQGMTSSQIGDAIGESDRAVRYVLAEKPPEEAHREQCEVVA